jgi:CubicO group peptidase (beta-lactamase class C family)
VTVGHLLSHTSGLPSSVRFYRELSGEEAIRAAVRSTPLVARPGTTCVYSDLGIILLGELLEAVAGQPFASLVRQRVLGPLGLADTLYAPPASELHRIAPTEDNAWRGGMVRGAVHDNNAFAMGGLAPHAGLFATAADVARLAASFLPGAAPRLVPDAVLSECTAPAEPPPGPWMYGVRILGTDPLFGAAASATTFGAIGFTGTLLAVDPERSVAIALLSNAIHPTRQNLGITAARGLVLDRVLLAVDPYENGIDHFGDARL